MTTALRQLLQQAIEAVPAVRYAAGLTGVAAAVAIIASFSLGPAIAVLGVVVTLGLMAVLLAFARAAGVGAENQIAPGGATGNGGTILNAGLVMVWVFTLLTCATGIMVFTVTFFGTPTTWQQLLGPSYAAQGSLSWNRDSSSVAGKIGASGHPTGVGASPSPARSVDR
jgi:hypothetical protein